MQNTPSMEIPLAVETIDEPMLEQAPLEQPRPRPRLWPRVLIILGLVAFACWAIDYGIKIRPALYLHTTGLHWGDATNGLMYGRGTQQYGLFHLYEPMYQAQQARIDPLPGGIRTALDYPPLRLVVMAGWARWAHRTETPNALGFAGESSAVILPMLRLNTACELISSILVFMLIRMWVLRGERARRGPMAEIPWWRGIPSASIGALLMWFNPGLLWNSYAFPQWDTWILPFFLAAVLAASVESWFVAGVMIALGTFLKGQMLMVAPLFVLWPLMQLKWDAAIRWIGGFAITSAAIVLPFMEPTKSAMIPWMLQIGALSLAIPFVMRWRFNYWVFISLGLIALPLAWPWTSTADKSIRFLVLAVVGAVWLARFAPARVVPPIFALAVAILVFLLIPLYGVSDYWYKVGFKYGTEKFSIMARPGTNNLPAILESYFRWTGDPKTMSVPLTWLGSSSTVTMRTLTVTIFAICLLLCSYAAARHARRGDPRFLLAVITPWLCSFAFMTQLNNRYLVWAAALSALLPAVGVGMTLLGVLISLLDWAGVAQIMYASFAGGSEMNRYLTPMQTHLGWMVILLALIYLYVSLAPRPRLARRTA